MNTSSINGDMLLARGWQAGKSLGLALRTAARMSADGADVETIMAALDAVLRDPSAYTNDAVMGDVSTALVAAMPKPDAPASDLRDAPLPYPVWGKDGIDPNAINQMDNAMRLPVSAAGALMPDAHVGYGLPIGGVLATEGAVIPYAVGVDIACLAGNTKIPLLDGKDYSLEELSRRTEPFPVYACKPDGKIVVALATAFKTRAHAALVEVELDNGEMIACTPDHLFMLRNGGYCQAQHLCPGASLMPFYCQLDQEGYARVQQNYSGAWLRHKRLVHGVTGKLFNHKVIAVRPSERKGVVYCLSVPVYENFAISAGVFVHNCRMRLSVLDASPIVLNQQKGKFEKVLRENTRFGAGAEWNPRQDDEVLDDPDWNVMPFLRHLKDKAAKQLGTSGSGNHFVEFGELEVLMKDESLGVEPGKYLAVLSHSGSRGVGFQIADRYSKLAAQMHPELRQGKGDLSHLGWLDTASEAGQEYWLAMNLAGRFASANHRVIHRNVSKAAGFKPIAVVENHHNFSWVEKLEDGREVYVHRKGATPAGKGVLGVIPGTMGDVGYVVRGLGNANSLNSASHGAGRQMSRSVALKTITKPMRDAYLRERGVTLLGGGLDEAPQAYKDINAVINAQSDLVEVIARFKPKIVMMTDDPRDV